MRKIKLKSALDDLIPIWCEGIDPMWLESAAGQDFLTEFWINHQSEALSQNQTARLLLGLPDKTPIDRFMRLRPIGCIPRYPLPKFARKFHRNSGLPQKCFYLRSDVEAYLKLSR